MIESIEVTGFRTLHEVKIPFARDITVLVGANNSGKSNVISLLSLLGSSATTGDFPGAIARLGGAESAITRGRTPDALRITVTFADGDTRARYELGLTELEDISYNAPGGQSGSASRQGGTFPMPGGGTIHGPIGAGLRFWGLQPNAPRAISALHSTLSGVTARDFSVPSLREPSVARAGAQLEPDGRNLGAVLDDLTPELRDAVERDVRASATEISHVLARNALEPGKKVVAVQERNGNLFTASDMSDGLLLLIALTVSSALAGKRPSVLAIEEPERGIHPRRLRDLLDVLKSVAKRGTQVVLTTHSPQLLDEFRDQPESVLILDRDDAGTHVTRLLDRQEWATELQGKPLGEIWYSGILGGVPRK